MGLGTLHCKSSKQKLNTRSSTESELVGVSEYLPYNIWQINFYKEQGYDILKNIVFQDNQSAIKMEINGRNSCTGNSRHIDIKYFWVKNRIDDKEVEIEYCPTTLMLGDYFTKPLQGNLFRRFRSVIMGHTHINDLLGDEDFPLKERVEKMHNIVIKKSSPPQDNGNITYADVVKNSTGNKQDRQTVGRGLYDLKSKGESLVRSKSQSEIKRPPLVSLFMINPDC